MGSNQSIMHSVPPTGLFLILIVQACTAGKLSLPSLPEAVQLLQLETIRRMEQTILAKEDENRRLEETILTKKDENQRLEEIIRSVEIEKEAVTRQNTMMEEEMVQIISERESLIEELESRLQFLERDGTIGELDGTIGELEARIQSLEMEKAAIEKESLMVMVAMESEKTQMREEFVKKQMERDARCQDEKREIQDLKNKELDEISERLDQSEMAVAYMSTIMIHSNQMAEEQQNLLKVQAGAIKEFNEEVKVGRNCSSLLGATADRISVQEEATNQLQPVRVDYQCQGDTNRSFQLPCPGGVCSSMELPSCTDSLQWEKEEVSFEKCQELTFKGASVLCGLNGTKETRKKLDIGGGLVEEVVATPCNDCGDLEWSAWAPCANVSSGRTIEGMLCRRRGSTYMGYEEEEKEFICEAPWTQLSTGCYR